MQKTKSVKYLKREGVMNRVFDFTRFWRLIKMELYRSKKGITMTLVISFGVLFFMGLLLTPVFEPTMLVFQHSDGYAFQLLICGFILSSLTFNDLGNTLKRYQYLMLPASTFEKFLSMWLLTTVGWVAVYTMLYTVYTVFANFVGEMMYSYLSYIPFNPFSEFSLVTIRYYLALQGIFMVGATHFKGFVFPKTLISIIVFGMVLALIGYFILSGLPVAGMEQCVTEFEPLEGSALHTLWGILVWMFWWVLAPLCWVISYFGLKEKEV